MESFFSGCPLRPLSVGCRGDTSRVGCTNEIVFRRFIVARNTEGIHLLHGPFVEHGDERNKALTCGRECILYAWWQLSKRLAGNEAILLQLTQRLRQHLVCDAQDAFAQRTIPACAGAKLPDDATFVFAADALKGIVNGTDRCRRGSFFHIVLYIVQNFFFLILSITHLLVSRERKSAYLITGAGATSFAVITKMT